MSFAFDDDADWSQEPLDLEDTPEEQFTLNLTDEPPPPEPPPPKPPAAPAPEPKPAVPAPEPKPAVRAQTPKEEPLPNMRWDDPEENSEPEPPGTGVRLRTMFVFLFLVVSAYALLARTMYADPQWTERLMRALPPLATGGDDRLLNRRVRLVDVEGRVWRTKEGDDVFLITGNAENDAAVPLRNVQILAKLLDKNGTPLQDQMIFCGNSIPGKMLHDLSSQQVAIIPRLRPNSRFMIQPGEKGPFVIAFVNPPSAVTEFTTQVVSAQRQA